ncbi:MAG: aldehyde dehydrogenase family protein [Acidimicrobiales bacterium]
MEVRDKLYIDGAWVAPHGDESIAVVDSTTEQTIGTVPLGSAEDVDAAVLAARAAFVGWSKISPTERAKYATRIGEALSARMSEIAELIAHEVGMPIGLSAMIQAGLPIGTFSSMSDLLEEITWEEQVGNSLVVKEPVGVVGAITPWNYPLHQIAAKVAPAITAGCTVVLKPSEVAPLNAFLLAEVIDEVGLPPGVFNLVSGLGPVVGEALASHPAVDMISFTGSTRAGRRVTQLAAETVKRVALELGGKSPNVILEDANLQMAVPHGVTMCYLNSGQTCSALTRMIVPRSRLAEVEELATKAAEEATPGSPFDERTRLGPLVSGAQRDRVRGYIQKGIDEGARLLVGGVEPPEGLSQGFFVQPTVFSDVTREMTIAREEIFGPVLVIMAYDTEEEAIDIANDSDYGLAGGVWSGDAEHAKEVARKLRTGRVDVNGGAFNTLAPFGGYKQSGNGRELGKFGLEEFLEIKSLQL